MHLVLEHYGLGWYEEFDVTLVAEELVQSKRLYGPASLRDKTLIYPCEAFKFQIGYPCQMCRMMLRGCDHFDDHLTFHLSNHTKCKYCNKVERGFPNFSYNVVHKSHNPSAWNEGH